MVDIVKVRSTMPPMHAANLRLSPDDEEKAFSAWYNFIGQYEKRKYFSMESNDNALFSFTWKIKGREYTFNTIRFENTMVAMAMGFKYLNVGTMKSDESLLTKAFWIWKYFVLDNIMAWTWKHKLQLPYECTECGCQYYIIKCLYELQRIALKKPGISHQTLSTLHRGAYEILSTMIPIASMVDKGVILEQLINQHKIASLIYHGKSVEKNDIATYIEIFVYLNENIIHVPTLHIPMVEYELKAIHTMEWVRIETRVTKPKGMAAIFRSIPVQYAESFDGLTLNNFLQFYSSLL